MDTLHHISLVSGLKQSVFLPRVSKGQRLVLPTTKTTTDGFGIVWFLCLVFITVLLRLYLWMDSSGTDSSSFPWSSPHVASRGQGRDGGGGGVLGLGGMPELNSNSPPSNSQASALTSSATCPLRVVMVARCSPRTLYTHTLWGLHPSCNTIPICCTICLTFPPCSPVIFLPSLTCHLLLFVHSSSRKWGIQTAGVLMDPFFFVLLFFWRMYRYRYIYI